MQAKNVFFRSCASTRATIVVFESRFNAITTVSLLLRNNAATRDYHFHLFWSRSIEVVTTNDAEFAEVPKTEINSLEYEGGAGNEYESQSVSNDSTSAKQQSEDEYAVDELLFENQEEPEEFCSRSKASIPATPFVTKQTAQGHSSDIFFRAMCATVKTFPDADIAEIKLKISQIVGTKEIEILNRAPK